MRLQSGLEIGSSVAGSGELGREKDSLSPMGTRQQDSELNVERKYMRSDSGKTVELVTGEMAPSDADISVEKMRPDELGGFETIGDITAADPVMSVRGCDVHYGDTQALIDINLDIGRNEVVAMIGPSGCGKSTFIRCLNRMNDTIESARVTGEIRLYGEDIYAKNTDVVSLRARVGMVFQKPNPFPKTIYENVAYGPRIHGLAVSRAEMDDIVYGSLERAGLIDEVRDRLDEPGTGLSGGQQQRLCIARTIAVNPEVILMDEPCSALDPIATAKIEDLIDELSQNYAIAIVTHSMHQAARVSQRTAYFHLGHLVEVDATDKIFTNPVHRLTDDYVTGRFG